MQMTLAELKQKIAALTRDIKGTSSPYLKDMYAEQRGRYEHEIRRQQAHQFKGEQHGQEKSVRRHRTIPRKRNN